MYLQASGVCLQDWKEVGGAKVWARPERTVGSGVSVLGGCTVPEL